MNKQFLLDLVERTIATYVQAVLGLLLADSTQLVHIGTVRVAAVAALPAALAVVKGALAGSIGTSGTASVLPSRTPPTTPAPTAAAVVAPVSVVPAAQDGAAA